MSNGVGRSNALPIFQRILGAVLLAPGALIGLTDGPAPSAGRLLALSGAVQILAVILTTRRNQRLDRAGIDPR